MLPMLSLVPETIKEATAQVRRLVQACQIPQSRDELQERLGLEHRENFRKAYLVPALASGLIERTIPGRPNSRLQKHRLSEVGRTWLAGEIR